MRNPVKAPRGVEPIWTPSCLSVARCRILERRPVVLRAVLERRISVASVAQPQLHVSRVLVCGTALAGKWNLLKGIAAKGKIVGFDVVEIAPGKDHQNMTSLLAARLVLNLLGAMAHDGQIGTDRSRWV